jgi:hypothetical protein
MKLYRAIQDETTVRLSPDPFDSDSLTGECVVDEIDREVPVVDGVVRLWEGDDGKSYPHLHYVCPRCSTEHNVDLYPEDPNPRFACCDSCGWDSVVWIRWRIP